MLSLEQGMARLEEIARRARPRAGATRVIAIDGRSGAGKTDMGRLMASRLRAPLVELESLYGGWTGLPAGIGRLMADVLEPLARGEVAHVPRYDWLAEAWAEPRPLEPMELLVVEGVGAGSQRARPYLSVLAWLELPEPLRHARAMARDGDLYAGHWQEWKLQEDRYLSSDHPREHADLLISGES